MTQNRYITKQIKKDLNEKMVFLSGPRQVGKTTIAKKILNKTPHGYLNWDIPKDRESILKQELPNSPIWAFDEIHKYNKWRNYLKGIYDEFSEEKKILVTGSAKLDVYRRGGDSLQGRFFPLRLHPLSVAELGITTQSDWQHLLERGGFPEPFFGKTNTNAKRWSQNYRARLIEEELLSLETVKDIGTLELLMIRLPDLVASPLSINALREDLNVAHKTVANWLDIFSNLYAIFRLSPFGAPNIRAVKKEQKHYHFDWSLIEKEGPRFENVVASHLLKWVHFKQDTEAKILELRYFRDTDKREIDFIITEKNIPIIAIECKLSDGEISPHLKYFKQKFPSCTAYQLTAQGTKDYISPSKIHHQPALKFLKNLI